MKKNYNPCVFSPFFSFLVHLRFMLYPLSLCFHLDPIYNSWFGQPFPFLSSLNQPFPFLSSVNLPSSYMLLLISQPLFSPIPYQPWTQPTINVLHTSTPVPTFTLLFPINPEPNPQPTYFFSYPNLYSLLFPTNPETSTPLTYFSSYPNPYSLLFPTNPETSTPLTYFFSYPNPYSLLFPINPEPNPPLTYFSSYPNPYSLLFPINPEPTTYILLLLSQPLLSPIPY